MRIKRSQLLLLVPIMLLTQAYACQTTAQKILNKVASENLAFERAVTKAHTDKVMTDDQERQFLGWSRRIAETGNSAVVAFQKSDNAGALVAIDQGISVVDDALNNGLLGIKNQDTKTALSAALLVLRGSFTTAKGFVAGGVQ